MTATRRDTRQDYRHFPPAYADLVRRFRDTGRAEVGPLTQGSARSTVRDLYRFRMFLVAAMKDDPGDTYARDLFNIFNEVILRIEPVAVLQSPDDPCTHLVRFSLNPVVAAMRQVKE
jgi:hypothetical protein